LHVEPHHPRRRRRAIRKLGLAAALAAAALLIAQVVLAVPPTADFTPSDSVPEVGETVTFTSSVDDPDGDGSEGGIRWDFDYTGTFTEDATGPTASTTYGSRGSRTVAMVVTDGTVNDGTADPVLVTKELRVNAPPRAIVDCSPPRVRRNEAITCTSSGSEDAEGPVSYAWDVNGDGFNDGTDPTEQFSFPTSGSRNIRLQVTDSDGATAIASDSVHVSAPPTADFTISDPVPEVGQTVNFSASVTDPDAGDTHMFAWDFGDGTNGTGRTPSHAYTSRGTKTVRLTVTDSGGESTTVTKELRVNAPPTATVSCSPDPVRPNEATTCSSDGSGDVEGPLSYAWDLDNDGQFDDGSDPSEQVSFPSAGTRTIRLRVTDSDGATATAQDTVTVSNVAPTARFTFSPENPNVNETITFDATGSSDPEGQALRYEWDLDGDGGFDDATGQTITHAFSTGGNKTVQLLVTDPQNNSDVETRIVTVGNRPPIASFTFRGTSPATPDVPDVGEPIDFESTSTDPDGNQTIVDWDWDLDDDGQFDDASGPTVRHAYSTPGNKTVGLRVTDSSGATHSTTRTVPVNAAPHGAFTFSPEFPLPGQPVTFTSTSRPLGPGNAIAGVEWDFDFDVNTGVFTRDAAGPSVGHSFGTPGAKTVAIRVTETPTGTVDIEAGTVTVNAPPRAAFSVSPQPAFVNDTVTLSSSSADPDGPLTRQDWDLDNDGQFDDATGAVVFTKFAKRGTYPLKLRVTDARGATATAEGSVRVRRRPTPVLSGVDIDLNAVVLRTRTKVSWLRVRRLTVRAPRGSKVTARCRGKRCPKRAVKTSKGSRKRMRLHAVKTSKGSRKRMRFKTFERRFRPKTKLIVTVTKSGFIGRQTSWTIRRRKVPLKRNRCLPSGAKKATRCPEQ
jgi:PKD repeat protein